MFTVEKIVGAARSVVALVILGFVLNMFYVEDAEAARRGRGRGRVVRGAQARRVVARPAVRRAGFVRRAPANRGFRNARRFGLNANRFANVPAVGVNNNNANLGDLDIFGTSGNLGVGQVFNSNALLAQQLAVNSLATPTFAVTPNGQVVELRPGFVGSNGNPIIDPSLLVAAQSNGGLIPSSAFPGGVIPQQAVRQNVVIGTDGRILFGESQPLLSQAQQNAQMFNQGQLSDFQRQALQLQQQQSAGVVNATPVVSLRR